MNELTSEWINKAENDFLTARVVINQIAEPLPDIACFHCQQYAEKYLKGFLTEHKIEFPYKHMLVPLLE